MISYNESLLTGRNLADILLVGYYAESVYPGENMKRKALTLALLSQSAIAAAVDGSCLIKANDSNNSGLLNALEAKFQSLHGVKIDWVEALEVSDDKEGSNCVFSNSRGQSVTIPFELATNTAPNKFITK